MKLSYRRTLLVGFAFFLICVFWQAYDSIIPKILTDKFGLSQFWSGVIMALDNILAVFLLPVFGAVSDRHKGRRGRRTPFIIAGTIAAAILFVGLSYVDTLQLAGIKDITAVCSEAEASPQRDEALMLLYDSGVTVSRADGQTLADIYGSGEEFVAAVNAGSADIAHIAAARQAYAWRTTCENPVVLAVFIALLLGVLISMAVFRSPAVALMPDVTPKPLRSKANAVINLMGTAGGILVLLLGILFGTGAPKNTLMPYTLFFMTISGVMLAALLIFVLFVREKQWAGEMLSRETDNDRRTDGGGKNGEADAAPKRKLSSGEFRSLCFLLASVALWFTGYNAVTSKYSVYAGEVLRLDFNTTLLVAQAAAIVSFLPVGFVATKVGRRKTILAGIIMLFIAFTSAAFLRAGSSVMIMNVLFALAGIGWATINVNSYPMVVELAKSGDVGRYTGFYYTASMSAQIVTPILSGALLTSVGMLTLFPYAAIFVALSFVTMLFVRHGDSRGFEVSPESMAEDI